jgi:hypothetical protein
VRLPKYFSNPSLVHYFFPTQSIINLELQIGGRPLKPIHLGQSTYLADHQQILGFAMPLTSLCKTARPKPIFWAKPACFDFSSSNFLLAKPHTEYWWSCSRACPPRAIKRSVHYALDETLLLSGTQFSNAYDTMPSKRASTRKLLFFWLASQNDWSRWWHFNSLSLCIVHFLELIGWGGGKEWGINKMYVGCSTHAEIEGVQGEMLEDMISSWP